VLIVFAVLEETPQEERVMLSGKMMKNKRRVLTYRNRREWNVAPRASIHEVDGHGVRPSRKFRSHPLTALQPVPDRQQADNRSALHHDDVPLHEHRGDCLGDRARLVDPDHGVLMMDSTCTK
jgi:hypothetical protein